MACELDSGITKDCDQKLGPGGIAELRIIDRAYFETVTKDGDGYITAYTLTAPNLFFKVDLQDSVSSMVNDVSSDVDAGALYRTVVGIFRIEDTPMSRTWLNNLAKTNVVIAYKTKKGEWYFAGIGADGLRLKIVTESAMTAATPESRTTQLFTLQAEENFDEGVARVWFAGITPAARDTATQAAIDADTTP